MQSFFGLSFLGTGDKNSRISPLTIIHQWAQLYSVLHITIEYMNLPYHTNAKKNTQFQLSLHHTVLF